MRSGGGTCGHPEAERAVGLPDSITLGRRWEGAAGPVQRPRGAGPPVQASTAHNRGGGHSPASLCLPHESQCGQFGSLDHGVPSTRLPGRDLAVLPAACSSLPPSPSTGAERKVEPFAKYAKKEGRKFSVRKTEAGREPELPALTKAGSEIICSSDVTGCGGAPASCFSQQESRVPQRQKWPREKGRGARPSTGRQVAPHTWDSGFSPGLTASRQAAHRGRGHSSRRKGGSGTLRMQP